MSISNTHPRNHFLPLDHSTNRRLLLGGFILGWRLDCRLTHHPAQRFTESPSKLLWRNRYLSLKSIPIDIDITFQVDNNTMRLGNTLENGRVGLDPTIRSVLPPNKAPCCRRSQEFIPILSPYNFESFTLGNSTGYLAVHHYERKKYWP